jgi:hypothetical protein
MRLWWMGPATALVLLSATPAGAAQPAKPAYKLDTVTLGIRHRVFPDFLDLQQVRLKQRFVVGDTKYTATVVEFVPDFAMGLKSQKVISRSSEPNNPAFKIVVRLNGKPQDTTWAMLKMPPHFGRKSMLAFKVARIDFVGRPPLVNADTSGAKPPARGGKSGPASTPVEQPRTAPGGPGK